ncbi:MAG: H-NS histone family protein [Comamonadaceae bacterium]|nr:H-NS histone family protein [Comamonadaceae bacterium]
MPTKKSAPNQSTTYAEIQAEIERLKAEAEVLRQQETADVIAEIKQSIKAYGLTAADLGLGQKTLRSGRATKSAAKPAFADGTGNTWVGRGKRPEWLRAALAAGKTMDELRVS